MSTTTADRPTFSRGAIVAWARSIGIPDTTALEFMKAEGVIITEGRQAPEQNENVRSHAIH